MWIEVLDNEEIELLLEKPLIEKLERTLDNWIMKPNAKKEEMVVWVNGWKGFLGSVVERIERIGAGFERMKGLVEKKKDI